MTCVPSDPRFRLLDRLVGWDGDSLVDLAGEDEAEGLRLAGTGADLTSEALDPFIPPPRLAPGCGPCDWVLATRAPPESRILVLGPCDNEWRPAWRRGCVPYTLERAVAIAVDRHRLAVAEASGRIFVSRLAGGQVIGEAKVEEPRDIAFGPHGTLFAAIEGGTAIAAFTESGGPLGRWPGPLPEGRIERMAFDRHGLLWLVVRHGGKRALFAQAGRRSAAFEAQSSAALAAAFTRLALVRSNRQGFCLSRGTADSDAAELCWDWHGRRLGSLGSNQSGQGSYAERGQLLTVALDSGIPRCRWHRIRIDADIPDRTGLAIAVAVSDVASPAPQGVSEGDWAAFPGGVPHPDDWQELDSGLADSLIRQPAGRYLFVRLRLWGDGTATPRVRRVHIDFPRATSADLLPAVYHEDETSGAFTERFLSLFDASLETVAETVRRFPALLDGDRAPAEVLPWIASFLSVALDEGWSVEARRRILRGAPDLFRKRGTVAGLDKAIRLAFLPEPEDGAPAIVEHGWERAWGGVASASGAAPPTAARLGATRLYGLASARFAVGRSALGRTPLMSFGDPGEDPHRTGAFRFSVAVPPARGMSRTSLIRLIDGQKPAHTLASVHIGGEGNFVLGTSIQLGIDTLLRMPAPMALGDPALRLRRGAILAGHRRQGIVLGMASLTSPSSSWSDVR
jgi:phage tail-like protein